MNRVSHRWLRWEGGGFSVDLDTAEVRFPAADEKIIESSGTPYFAFKDIDENRPTGSIKFRVEMMDYFLRTMSAEAPGSSLEAETTELFSRTY